MSPNPNDPTRPGLTRRSLLRSSLAAAGAAAVTGSESDAAPSPKLDDRRASSKRFDRMKKSINLWAFPYPDRMSLHECLQLAKSAGFDGIELNYDLDNDLSPKASPADLRAIRSLADDIGLAISGVCSFLYWPYSLTDNDPSRRARGLELAA